MKLRPISETSAMSTRCLLAAALTLGCAQEIAGIGSDAAVAGGGGTVTITYLDGAVPDSIVIGHRPDITDAAIMDNTETITPDAADVVLLEAFTAGSTTPGRNLAVFAHVLFRNNVLAGRRLMLTIVGGEGKFERNLNVTTMREICLSYPTPDNAFFTDRIVYPSTTDSNIGQVVRAPHDSDCPSGYSPSGWYMSVYTPPRSVERDELVTMRVTDRDFPIPIEESFSLMVRRGVSSSANLSGLRTLVHTHEVNAGDFMATVIFANDHNGGPLTCFGNTSVTNGENPAIAGCDDIVNPDMPSSSITINSRVPAVGSAGAITINTVDSQNVWIHTRTADRAVTCLGGGAFVGVIRAQDRMGRGEWRVEGYAANGTPLPVELNQVNITR